MEWSAQEGAQEMTARGSQCSVLGDKLGMGHRLDLMILELFSNLNDPGIL